MFLQDWNDLEDIKSAFVLSDDDVRGVRILLASYESDGNDSYAYVLFALEGKLYEVRGSHCSCYGLEDQWVPDEVTVAELRHRHEKGRLGRNSQGGNDFADELKKVLDEFSS